jgi:hypothetical protein
MVILSIVAMQVCSRGLSKQCVGFIRVFRDEEPDLLEIVRIDREEVHEFVQVYNFGRFYL